MEYPLSARKEAGLLLEKHLVYRINPTERRHLSPFFKILVRGRQEAKI